MYHPGCIDAGCEWRRQRLVLSAWPLQSLGAFLEEGGRYQVHVQSLPAGEDHFSRHNFNWKHVEAPLDKAPN